MQDCQLGPELNRPGKMSIGRFQRYLIEIIPSSKSLDFATLLYTGLYLPLYSVNSDFLLFLAGVSHAVHPSSKP